MKSSFYALVLVSLFSFRYLDDIYSLSFKNIDGTNVELKSFKGKKMMFVVLPLSAGDTTISINDLEALQEKYDTSVVFIGILAEEEGFKKGEEGIIKNLYKGMKPGFLISEGVKVKKASGTEQSTIFQWLTNKDKNRHFNQEVQGVGTKFFVDESGELYAVLGSKVKLNNPVIDRILTKSIIKKSN